MFLMGPASSRPRQYHHLSITHTHTHTKRENDHGVPPHAGGVRPCATPYQHDDCICPVYLPSPRGCLLCPRSSRKRETWLNHQVPRLQFRSGGLVSHDLILVVFGAHGLTGPNSQACKQRDHLGGWVTLDYLHFAATPPIIQTPRLGFEASDVFGSRACLFARSLPCHSWQPSRCKST